MLGKLINIETLIHSLKTLIACVIGISLTYIISLPSDQWIVVTIIVVMCSQLYVGSVIQKSFWRFIGTLFGCLFAIVALKTLGDSSLDVMLAVGFSSLIFSFICVTWESIGNAGTLGAVTTAIIMLGQKPTVLFAAERFLEISLGLLIATLVSQFVLPIRARTHLRRSQIRTLEAMRDYYVISLTKPLDHIEKLNYQEMDEEITKLLLKQRQLAAESKHEPMSEQFNQQRFLQKIYCEKEMLRAITFMHIAFVKILKTTPGFGALPSLLVFNQMVTKSFNTIIEALSQSKDKINFTAPQIKTLTAECEKDLHDSEHLLYIEGFLYCAELLSRSLAKLATLAGCLSEAK